MKSKKMFIQKIKEEELIVLFLMFLTASLFYPLIAEGQEQPKTLVKPPEIISFELFSWKTGDKWYFSLFRIESFGARPMKNENEIKDPSRTIDLLEVKKRVSSLPQGSVVIWRNVGPDSLPDEMLKEIEELCGKNRIRLLKIPYRSSSPPQPQHQEKKELTK